MKIAAILFALPLMVSCQRPAHTPTAEENLQLDDASNLLNAAPANLNAVDDHGLNAVATSNEGGL